jgi:AcrR family transcriptional regulator
MSPRPDVSEERRKQILEAAMNVFARMGFHEARMDDIVEESGLSKGTLYWYFKSKDDIIESILTSLFEQELAGLENAARLTGSAYDQLAAFLDQTLNDFQRMLRLRPLMFEFYTLAFRQKGVREALRNYFRRYMDGLTPIIQRGIDQGEFAAADARSVAIALGALFEGTLLLWAYDPETVDLEKNIESAARLMLNGLRPQPAPNAG